MKPEDREAYLKCMESRYEREGVVVDEAITQMEASKDIQEYARKATVALQRRLRDNLFKLSPNDVVESWEQIKALGTGFKHPISYHFVLYKTLDYIPITFIVSDYQPTKKDVLDPSFYRCYCEGRCTDCDCICHDGSLVI